MYKNYFLLFSKIVALSILITGCKKDLISTNSTAYFGGEVANPTSRFVLFCKDNVVLDSIPLKADNTFLIKFDTLNPGLYSFKHEPEYQYVYFDKNDSIMVHINTNDFDESIVFCGRGDEKNNFLMDMYLKNEKDKNKMFTLFDTEFKNFNSTIEKTNTFNQKFYNSKKEEINWSSDFDLYANALVNFPYFSKKELYPVIHKIRTGKDVSAQIPENYYAFRKNIDFNNEKLINFSPFVKYINQMLNNISSINYHNHYSNLDLELRTNVNKLKITDTLIDNKKVKNEVLNNIAFQYLLEDQNMVNNKEFLLTYQKISTDKSQKNEIIKLENSIKNLTFGKKLPEINLQSFDGTIHSSDELINSKTVIYFWSQNLESHFEETHKKIMELKLKHPDYTFISINLDEKSLKWKPFLIQKNFSLSNEFHCVNFEEIKSKWAITKIHRTLIINGDKTIKNAFTNLFDVNFEKEL